VETRRGMMLLRFNWVDGIKDKYLVEFELGTIDSSGNTLHSKVYPRVAMNGPYWRGGGIGEGGWGGKPYHSTSASK